MGNTQKIKMALAILLLSQMMSFRTDSNTFGL